MDCDRLGLAARGEMLGRCGELRARQFARGLGRGLVGLALSKKFVEETHGTELANRPRNAKVFPWQTSGLSAGSNGASVPAWTTRSGSGACGRLGAGHLITVAIAHFTPVPPGLGQEPGRAPGGGSRSYRTCIIGFTIIFAGVVSLLFAPELVSGSTGGRIVCAGIALW
jgi:hypothetical protein